MKKFILAAVLAVMATPVFAQGMSLEQRVGALEADVATLQIDVAALQSGQATNTADIATNAAAIAANAAAIAANDTEIAANALAISNNAAAISTNAAAISTNQGDIAANVAAISANTSAISANTAAITALQSDVAALDSRVTTLENNPGGLTEPVTFTQPVSGLIDGENFIVFNSGFVMGGNDIFDVARLTLTDGPHLEGSGIDSLIGSSESSQVFVFFSDDGQGFEEVGFNTTATGLVSFVDLYNFTNANPDLDFSTPSGTVHFNTAANGVFTIDGLVEATSTIAILTNDLDMLENRVDNLFENIFPTVIPDMLNDVNALCAASPGVCP